MPTNPPKRRKGKGGSEPRLKLVAPEPPCEEGELNWAWDPISAAAPSFGRVDPPSITLSEAPLSIQWDLREAAPLPLHDPHRHPPYERLVETWEKAQTGLRAAEAEARATQGLLEDFRALEQAENTHEAAAQTRLANALTTLRKEIGELDDALIAELTASGEELLDEIAEELRGLTELAANDRTIKASFAERTASLAECERVKDAYYDEHQTAVREIRRLREETNTIHNQELNEMVATLMRTSEELTASLFTDSTEGGVGSTTGKDRSLGSVIQGDKSPEYLVNDLIKLNRESSAAQQHQTEAIRSKAYLQRLVTMEKRQLEAAKSRNELLKRQLEALKKGPPQPAPLHPIQEVIVGGEGEIPHDREKSGINQLAEARRQLNYITKECAEAEALFNQLRQYHFSQFGGFYYPTKASGVIKPTAQTYLDPTIGAAIRQVVIEATIELNDAFIGAFGDPDNVEGGKCSVLEGLKSITSLRKRRAVQNYVVRKINNLFKYGNLNLPHAAKISM
ncbi:unnamed protein product [Phytomonas sp. Hart1]|nr:unnamed protein product [Phytomonas sp. Hart1]|eukprot:CCW66867.1 unnamed protein product [Phytomonas sp. isolate Hart1]